jgi:hypothetical protein
VQPGESAPPKRPAKSVSQAAKGGDQRELLVAMRDRIAQTVSNHDCPPPDLASLTKRLQDIAREIELIDARAFGDAGRLRALEEALREVAPEHPILAPDHLLGGPVSDRFDPSAI